MDPDRIAQFDQAVAAYKDHAKLSSVYHKELKANGLTWYEASAVVGFWLAGVQTGAPRQDEGLNSE